MGYLESSPGPKATVRPTPQPVPIRRTYSGRRPRHSCSQGRGRHPLGPGAPRPPTSPLPKSTTSDASPPPKARRMTCRSTRGVRGRVRHSQGVDRLTMTIFWMIRRLIIDPLFVLPANRSQSLPFSGWPSRCNDFHRGRYEIYNAVRACVQGVCARHGSPADHSPDHRPRARIGYHHCFVGLAGSSRFRQSPCHPNVTKNPPFLSEASVSQKMGR
jgi:hypothetical protein